MSTVDIVCMHAVGDTVYVHTCPLGIDSMNECTVGVVYMYEYTVGVVCTHVI